MTPLAAETGRKVVGAGIVRHDAVEKVQGRTVYAADFGLPRMLHAMLKRSDYAHAKLLGVDVSAAEAIEGVIAIYTAKDVPNNSVWVDVPGQTLEVGALKALQNVLADGTIRYHGEPVALVAAETEDAALAAIDAIVVDYEPLPVLDDPETALDPDAPRIHEGGNLLANWEIEEGDIEAGFSGAAVVVEETYRTQFIDHAYLEPEAGVAWRDADGVITIRAATQVVEHFRDVARILDLPDNKVRVITPYVGGGFGGKEDMTVEPYLGIVVALTGRPVRMVWTRQESLIARQNRHAVRMRYRTAADSEGNLLAQEIDILSDGGGYALLSALVLLYSTTCAGGPYRCPNVKVRARTVYTNRTPCSAMRGFGGMQMTLGYEGQMDRLAAELGIDPLEIRRRNFVERGDVLPIGQELETSVELPALIDLVNEQLGELPEPSSPRHRVGRGFACNIQPYGRCIWLNDWSSAWIGFELDGTLVIRIAVPDIGGGQASSLIQIASEELGVPPNRIQIHIGDSALNPLTGTTTATRQLYMSGNAVHKAARELRESLAGVAAELLEVDAETIDFHAGGVREQAGGREVPFDKLLATAASVNAPWHVLSTFRAPKGIPWQADQSWRGRVFPDFTYGCHAAEVEVDTDTGNVRVLRYLAAHDVGQVINRVSVEGQIDGAVSMGLGYALSERVVFEDGQNLTATFAQYLIPTAVEMPKVESLVMEGGEGLGPFNARGIGEPPTGPPAPTIAAAIADACDVRLAHLPFTPERVSDAIREGKAANGAG